MKAIWKHSRLWLSLLLFGVLFVPLKVLAQSENAPILLTPFNNQTITSDAELRGTIFSWTNTSDEYVFFEIAFYQVMPCQDPMTAFRVNHPIYVRYCDNGFFSLSEDMEFFDGEYVWSVTGSSSSYNQVWSPPSVFEVNTGSGLFIETNAPCDTPAGCLQVTKEKDKEYPISLGVSIASPDKFKYPRALPIRAEGLDYDKVTFRCPGCSANDGKEIRYFQDGVNSFDWVLEGKGSLGDPFKAQKVDSLNSELDDLNDKIGELQKEVNEKQGLVDSGIDQQKDVNEKLIEDLEKKKQKLDSLGQKIEEKLDSIKGVQEELEGKLADKRSDLAEQLDSMKVLQERLDTLYGLLNDEFTDGEMALLEEVKSYVDEKKELEEEMKQAQQDYVNEMGQLDEAIDKAESDIEEANKSYVSLQNQVETISQEITKLTSQLLSNKALFNYRMDRDKWSLKVKLFNEKYPISNFDDLYLSVFQEGEKLSNSATNRSTSFTEFTSKLSQLSSAIASASRKAGSTEASEALSIVQSAENNYKKSVDSLSRTSTVIDPLIKDKIETEQDKLSSIEAQLASAEAGIEQSISALEQAFQAYEDKMKEYEGELNANKSKLADLNASINRTQNAFNKKVEERRKKTAEKRDEYNDEVSSKELRKLDIQFDIKKIYDALIKMKEDSTNIANEKKFLEEDKRSVERQKEEVDQEIADLENANEELDNKKEELEEELEDLKEELDDLAEKRKELLGNLEAATAATKSATGAIVYYIPPTLDELLEGADATKFKDLVVKVEEKKDSLNQAMADKAGLQAKYSGMMVSIAKELIKLKENEESVKKLEEEKGEAEEEAAEKKREAGVKLREAREAEEEAREKLENDKEEQKEKIDDLDTEAKDAQEELDNYRKDIVEGTDSLLAGKNKLIDEKLKEIEELQLDANQHQSNMNDNVAKLREYKQKEIALRTSIGRENNNLSRASALDNIAGIASSRKELNRLEAEMESNQEQVNFYVENIGIKAKELKEVKDKMGELQKEVTQIREERFTMQSVQLENRKKLQELENDLEGAEADLLQANKDLKKLEQLGDSAEAPADIDSLMNEDEDLQKANKKLEEIEAKLEKLENEKKKAEAEIEVKIEEKKKAEEKSKDAVEKAEDALKDARKELQDFINEKFEKASFTTKLKIIADDGVADHWREDDDPKEETVTLTYSSRVASITGLTASGNGSTIEEPSKCYLIVENDIMNSPQFAGLAAGEEPRTRALLYEDGKLLNELWPVIPDDAPLLSKDVVIASSAFSTDKDEFNYQCISEGESPEEKEYRLASEAGEGGDGATSGTDAGGEGTPTGGDAGNTGGDPLGDNTTRTRDQHDGTRTRDGEGENGDGSTTDGGEEETEEDDDFCVSMAGLHDSIVDLGRYEFGGGVIVGPASSNTLGMFLWEPAEVAKDKKTERQMINAKYEASKIYKDDKVGGKGEYDVTAGVMIETSKSVKGSPGGKSKITTRVVQGDHQGLAGETIHLEVSKTYGDAEDFGFDEGGSTEKDGSTDGSGYLADTYFYYGKGYGKFEIIIQWKRGGEVIQEEKIEATSPLIHSYQIMAYEVNKKALDEAKKMLKNGSANVEGALGAIDTEDIGNWLVFGTLNFDNEFANGIELSFESEGEAKVEPESESTEEFGIAMTMLKDAPENEQFEVTSKTPEEYKDIAEDYEAKGKIDTEKIKEFKIGTSETPFVIVLDNEASPGTTISGDAHISVDAIPDDMPIKEAFKKLKIKVDGVKVEKSADGDDAEFIAKEGSVIYESAEGVKYQFSSFELTISSFGVLATTGASLTGEVKHEKLEEAVAFEAKIDGNGDFMGKISNLPEVELNDFKLKKGTSVILDMHRGESEAPLPDDFQGLVIVQATLELPESFNREGVNGRSTLGVQNFSIGKRGVSGKIGMDGQLLGLGFAGYEVKLKTLTAEFKNNELLNGTFDGVMTVPSPMEGEVGIKISLSQTRYVAELTSTQPLYLPQFKTTFVLKVAGAEYLPQKKEGLITLSAKINSEKHGDINIDGFKLTSKGEVEAENISVEEDIEIGKGFKMNLRHLGFHFRNERDYGMTFDGKVDFKGILAIDAAAEIKTGPTLTFKKLDIDFDKGPINFKGEFTYQQAVFQGKFDVKFKKFNKGLDGMLIVGNQPISRDESFSYWYGEIGAAFPIPIAQTGFSFLEFGGGVGYNFIPPLGNQDGSPMQDAGFSLKAKVGVGNAPGGELIAGRMELSYVSGNISMYGKAWALTKEESLYGEGQINLRNMASNPSIDGYIAAFVGLTDAEGALFLARGKINFSYPPNRSRYVWSEQLNASLFQTINADASLEISETRIKMDGRLTYDVNKEIPLGFGTLTASFDLNAKLDLQYVYQPPTGTARPRILGNWDVNVEAFDKSFDVINGAVNITGAELRITSSEARIRGIARARYKVLWYEGSKTVEIDSTTPI
ncbi:MAG: hypothetical protein JXR19_03675 [Bacteroidia bacterium]